MSESISNLKSQISNFPSSPGVYIFKDKTGKILYIGKAKNLKARVKQYFQNHDDRPQIPFLMKEAADLEYTLVSNELESLYFERTLIQKHTPKYNILLRDDKSYTFIAFDYTTEIPQILLTRKIADQTFEKRHFRDEANLKSKISRLQSPKAPADGGQVNLKSDYFGPYTAAYKVREVLKTIRYIFPYCTNTKVSNKPCFYYHLHRCPGVCIGVMPLNEYKDHLEKIKLFLKGDFKTVKKDIEKEMKIAASKKLFEKAARLRNQLKGLLMVEQKQSVIIPKKVNWDLVGLNSHDENTCINLFKVRGGKLIGKENFVYRTTKINAPTDTYGKNEILQKFLEDYYIEASDRPDKIYVKDNPKNKPLIEQLVKNRFHKKTSIIRATQKEPLRLLNMAEQNAGEYLKQSLSQKAGEIDKINSALNQLKEVLKLPQVPKRIECYDISNTQGTNPVGSMVVFVDGKPLKSQYRKFKIRGQQTPDDFAMMREMLSRRLNRITNQESGIMEKDKWPLPDLIVIDGGKGQLSAAVQILTTYNLELTTPIIGLAKRIEEIFLPNNPNPIILGHDQPALQLLQRLRDEAHRFGITFHRNLRSKQAVKSALDDISGIGPKTKKLLKEKFGTVAEIKQTSFDDLEKVVGKKLANTIKLKL